MILLLNNPLYQDKLAANFENYPPLGSSLNKKEDESSKPWTKRRKPIFLVFNGGKLHTEEMCSSITALTYLLPIYFVLTFAPDN